MRGCHVRNWTVLFTFLVLTLCLAPPVHAWDFEDVTTVQPGEYENWRIETRGSNIAYKVEVLDGATADIYLYKMDFSEGTAKSYYLDGHKHFYTHGAEGTVKGQDGSIYLRVDNSDKVGGPGLTSPIKVKVQWERQTSFWFVLEMALYLAMLFSVLIGIVYKYRWGREISRREMERMENPPSRLERMFNSTKFKTAMVLIFAFSLFFLLAVTALAEFVHETAMAGEETETLELGESEMYSMNLWNKGLHFKVEVLEGGPVDVYVSDLVRPEDPRFYNDLKWTGVSVVETTLRDTEEDLYIFVDNTDALGTVPSGNVTVKVTYELVWSNTMRISAAVCLALMVVALSLGLYSRRVSERLEGVEGLDETASVPELMAQERGDYLLPITEPEERGNVYSHRIERSDEAEATDERMYEGHYPTIGEECPMCKGGLVQGPSEHQVFCPNCNWAPPMLTDHIEVDR
jgi:hypothetical protein